MPSTSPRARSTPCQRGVAYATHSRTVGRRATGKNVPENRNIGTIAKRRIALNALSDSAVAAYAAIGAENASPVRSAARGANMAGHDWMPPNAAITARYAAALTRMRVAMNS